MASESVASGAEALARLERAAGEGRPFAFALIDHEMPEMSGVELAGAARRETVVISAPATAAAAARGRGDVRVLVAEDNDVNQFIAVRVLEKLGYAVDVVGDGRQAVAAATRGGYAAIFMDCQMPELDGYEATAAIRRAEGTAGHVPIIAMTASTMAGDRERCLAAGMDDYLPKPLPFDRLADICRRLVGSSSVAAPVAPAAPSDGYEPIFDPSRLGSTAAPPEVKAVLGIFLEHLEVSLGDLGRAFASGDRAEVDSLAHRLAGSAATIGAGRLAGVCKAICAAARDGAPHEFPRLAEELRNTAVATRAAISAAGPATRAT